MIVVVDTETTGLSAAGGDQVVEVAGVALSDEGVPLGRTTTTVVAAGRTIPAAASAVHHIRYEDTRDSPHLPGAWAALCRDLGTGPDTVWVAHNMQFDASFLAGYLGPVRVCTWRTSRHIWPDAPSHANQFLRYWLGADADVRLRLEEIAATGTPADPHRALADATVTSVILQWQLRTGRTIQELVRLTSTPVIQTVCRFGAKHRGQPWERIPRSYLLWMRSLSDLDDDTSHTVNYWLAKTA